jgi:hypothetical protein
MKAATKLSTGGRWKLSLVDDDRTKSSTSHKVDCAQFLDAGLVPTRAGWKASICAEIGAFEPVATQPIKLHPLDFHIEPVCDVISEVEIKTYPIAAGIDEAGRRQILTISGRPPTSLTGQSLNSLSRKYDVARPEVSARGPTFVPTRAASCESTASRSALC